MPRPFLAACAVVALAGSLLFAQPLPTPVDGKVIVPIDISPMGQPKLKSKVLLSTQYTESQPGNRVQVFMKAFMEMTHFFSGPEDKKREAWNATPLDQLPLDEIKASGCVGGLMYRMPPLGSDPDVEIFRSGGRPLSDVDEAARLRTVDWQEWFNFRRDRIGALLPEVQKMRALASVLKVRMRYEIRTGDFDKAIYSARTFYGLSQQFESHPCLIGNLVGIAIFMIEMSVLEEFIQQPGAPNLYWGLAEMGDPVMSLRTAVQGDRVFTHGVFDRLFDDRDVATEREVRKAIKFVEACEQADRVPKKGNEAGIRYGLLATDNEYVAESRKLLIELGMDADVVKTLDALHVAVAADVKRGEILREERFKAAALPFAEGVKVIEETEREMAGDKRLILAPAVVPAMGKAYAAHFRLNQRVALLRTIEAIRSHAADTGKLPAKLSDIKLVIPDDPVAGKPFEYELKGDHAVLHGVNAVPTNTANNIYYEILLRK